MSLWKIYCIEPGDEGWQYIEQESAPTECPNDPTHLVNPESVSEISTLNKVLIEEYTQGDFETAHIKMIIPAGTPGDMTEHDVSWPMDILLWKTILKPTSEMIGDEISVRAAPETTIGGITATVNIGDTVLNVSPPVFQHIRRGYGLTLNDGVNKNYLDRVTAVDAVAGTISVQTATLNSFSPGTLVQLSIYVIDGIDIIDTEKIPIAGKGMKGKTVPQGVILRVYYTNNSGTEKIFRWRPEYYNNG